MGSCGRLVKASPGKAVFFKDHAYKKLHPDRRGGVPPKAVFIVSGGRGASPIFLFLLIIVKNLTYDTKVIPKELGNPSTCKTKQAAVFFESIDDNLFHMIKITNERP